MTSKTERREGDAKKKPRRDTFRKKILRDMREFYRILFRKRFHISEYKSVPDIQKCLRVFFDELGLPLSEEELNDYQLFRYVHQTHQYTTKKIKPSKEALHGDSPFKVSEKYNDSNFKKFMKHPLPSRLFYFCFNNYLQYYYPTIKADYREEVMSVV